MESSPQTPSYRQASVKTLSSAQTAVELVVEIYQRLYGIGFVAESKQQRRSPLVPPGSRPASFRVHFYYFDAQTPVSS
ncbi:hypothetical protein ZHAS_00017159 [Anopheles sinensis]|uniref:Uncharacterized protein n=1 Tax=Anopheles sinensis TaxID=74873 RepID=A0A084WFA2_ANOSI|nr:hypothetical protein ZHAS_00017159 [Anopheles sinensis]